MGDAHLRVAVVEARGFADLLVKRVDSWGLGRGAARWYLCDDKQDAELYVFFCSPGMAQLKVCYVDAYGEAGWVTEKHPARRTLR